MENEATKGRWIVVSTPVQEAEEALNDWDQRIIDVNKSLVEIQGIVKGVEGAVKAMAGESTTYVKVKNYFRLMQIILEGLRNTMNNDKEILKRLVGVAKYSETRYNSLSRAVALVLGLDADTPAPAIEERATQLGKFYKALIRRMKDMESEDKERERWR